MLFLKNKVYWLTWYIIILINPETILTKRVCFLHNEGIKVAYICEIAADG